MIQEICNNCGPDGEIRYDYSEGTSVCVICGLVINLHFINDSIQIDDEFFDNECYDYYPLLDIDNDLPLSIVKDAYKRAISIINEGHHKGLSKINIHAASIFLICKEYNILRTYEEICSQYKISPVQLSKGMKLCLNSNIYKNTIDENMNNEMVLFNRYTCLFPIDDSQINKHIRKTFMKLLDLTQSIMIGKSSKTVVSCILCYIFEKSEFSKNITYNKHDVSNILNITTVTLNKNMNMILSITK